MMESLLVPNDLQRHWLVGLVVKTLREERWRRGKREGWGGRREGGGRGKRREEREKRGKGGKEGRNRREKN